MELKDKLKEVNAQVDAKAEEAKDQWKAFTDVRDEFAKSGEDANNTASDAFVKAEEAHKQYSKAAEELAELQQVRDGIFKMLATDGELPKAGGDQPGAVPPEFVGQKARKTAGERIAESDEYKAAKESGRFNGEGKLGGDVQLGKAMDRPELKALLTGESDTSAGAFVTPDRQGYYPMLERPLLLTDLITIGETDSDLVEYVVQTLMTHAAAETAEATSVANGAKPESAYAFDVEDTKVKTIAHWVPATKRALRDVGQLRTIIDALLRSGLDQRVDGQIVSGNGVGENIKGILATTGIGSYEQGTDNADESRADAIHRGITTIRLKYLEPNAVGMHPTSWQDIRLSRDDSGAGPGTGAYLFGPPALGGVKQIWGLPVVVGAQFPADTDLVGDYKQAILWLREGIQVLASDSHADFFVKNLVAVLAEMAAAFGVVRPDAFCEVTQPAP